ncbi:MAG: intramembrane zinc metalloprotease [Candidatus Westeberhardia cardiocondylae]|nr:intramembrane zinc metalloprotease [Candidatus Westeberhardia cardiocondylae]
MNLFYEFFIFIITVGILITVHEFGHFITARYYGVIVEKFSIGFGKKLWHKYDKKGTEYIIASIPLGGYVKMKEKNKNCEKFKNIHNQKYFHEKKNWEKAIIIAAGSIFNIFFSIIIYWIIFFSGIINYKPIIGEIIHNSVAYNSGLTPGMEIKSINNIKTYNWNDVQTQLNNNIKKNKIIIDIEHINKNNFNEIKTINLQNYNINYENNPIIELGIIPIHSKIQPILTKVEQNSAGMQAGLKPKDKIISVNGKMIKEWNTFIKTIQNNPNKPLNIVIERQNININTTLYPKIIKINNEYKGFAGLFPKIMLINQKHQNQYFLHPISSLIQAIKQTWTITKFILNKFSEFSFKYNNTFQNLSGPISIAHEAKTAVKSGLVHYLIFLSIISINLGIINLFPLPILDGGYLLFMIIEIIKKKPISKKTRKISYQISMIILIILMSIALLNDFTRFIKI